MLRFLARIFGADGDANYSHTNCATDERWRISENGNPAAFIDGGPVTVFPQDSGWTFVIGDGDDACFSGPYATQEKAIAKATAFAKGEPIPPLAQ